MLAGTNKVSAGLFPWKNTQNLQRRDQGETECREEKMRMKWGGMKRGFVRRKVGGEGRRKGTELRGKQVGEKKIGLASARGGLAQFDGRVIILMSLCGEMKSLTDVGI